jgi:chorismate mutase/prephenate dehydratase
VTGRLARRARTSIGLRLSALFHFNEASRITHSMVQPKPTSPVSPAAPVAASAPAAEDAAASREALEELRVSIDAVDRDLLAALNHRAELVEAVGQLKRGSGTSVYEPSRERRIVETLAEQNPGPFPNAGLAPVFREIISATRSLEEPVQVAYLGPEGTFSHQAARHQFGELGRLASVPTITEVFAAVEGHKVQLGVVPVENTTTGIVTETYDALAQFDVTICAEIVLRISHDLLSQSGRIEDVRRVVSHPQPLAQCRRWLDHRLPDAERAETTSTAVAARLATEDPGTAAIASHIAAEAYGLRAIESGIEDRRDNSTRFLVLGQDPPSESGNDRTSVVFTIRRDESGALHRLIHPFAEHGVNLTTIQLRPIHGKPWEYLFFLDLEGHRDEERVTRALEQAARVANSWRVLGSFPRAEGERGAGGRS